MSLKRYLIALLLSLCAVIVCLETGKVRAHAEEAYEIAVAVGGTVAFKPTDFTLRTFKFDNESEIPQEERGAVKYVMYENTAGARSIEFTGIRKGLSKGVITGYDKSGKKCTRTVNIYTTEPSLEPFEGYMVGGRAYKPSFKGTVSCSSYHLISQDTSVIAETTDKKGMPVFAPKSDGTTRIAVVVDGKTIISTASAVVPVLNMSEVLVGKKSKVTLEVSGIPSDMKVVYKSSDKTIAKVSADGVITGKSNGECTVTAKVYVAEKDVIKLKCQVTVGTKKSVAAVKAARKVLGAKYSQELRMREGYYDCSSLVWRCYKEAGLPISDDEYAPVAADIAKILEKKWQVVGYRYVEPDMLEVGDLIFYYNDDSDDRYRKISHVAMYYGNYCGDSANPEKNTGMIIHANNGVELTEYSTFRKSKIVLILRSGK